MRRTPAPGSPSSACRGTPNYSTGGRARGTRWTSSRRTRTWSPAAPSTRAASRSSSSGTGRAKYDLAIQLHGGGGSSNPFVERLGARVTAGARDTHLGAPALDRWVTYAYYQHEVLRFLEVVGLVGAPPVTLEPRLALTAADVRHADAALPATAQPLVALHPGASDPRRRWPPASFAAVATALADQGCRVAVVGHGPDDARAAAEIAATSPAVDLVGSLDMKALVGVLARARLVIANDSGPRHVAAALGTPTVGVYWVGNVINAGPLLQGAAPDRGDLPADVPRLRRQPGEHRHGAVPPRRLVRRRRHRRGGPEALARPARRPVTQSTSSGLIRDTLQIRNRRAARLLSRRDPASQATSTVTSSATAVMSPP